MTPPEAYERYLVPHLFGPWAEEIIGRAGDLTGLRILDVCTGTGVAARLAARAGAKVSGLDIDAPTLAVAAAQPGAGAIDWVEASALAMPFPDASFDRVFCLEGTQFFPDLVAGLAEIRRVMVPGGCLVTSNWGPLVANPGYQAISDGLRIFVSEAAARLPPVGLADPAKIAANASAAGFALVSVVPRHMILHVPSARDFVTWVGMGGPTIRHNIAQIADARREDFFRFVEDRLVTLRNQGGGLDLPSMRHILTATR